MRLPWNISFSYCFLVMLISNSYKAGAQQVLVDSSYNNGHYQHRVAYFNMVPHQRKEIIFLGNSITEAGPWQELLRGHTVLNRGISGDVTYGVLARLHAMLAAKPFKIFLLIGVNDIKRGIPVDTIAQTYERIIQKVVLLSPKTKLYLQSVLPVNETMLAPSYKNVTNEKINKLNEKIRALALQYKLTFINLHLVFAVDGELKSDLTLDGIHLKSIAYLQWVQYLKQLKLL